MHPAVHFSITEAMKPPLPARIRNRLTELKLSIPKATKKGGLGRTAIHDILDGTVRNPRGDTAEKLAKALDCDVGFITGSQAVPRINPDEAPDGTENFNSVSTQKRYQPHRPGGMPDIDVSAGAGPGGLPLPDVHRNGAVVFSADAVRGEIVLPDYVLVEFTRADPGRIHWIRVRGDSMEGTLEPGDRVGVDTTDTSIGQGGVFVIRDSDGEILVKRLRKVRGSDTSEIEIISDNPKQGNDVVASQDIAVIGRVVAKIARVG